MGISGVRELAEQQVFTERGLEVAVVLRQVRRVECGIARRGLNRDTTGAILGIALVRSEDEQAVPNERASATQRREHSRIVRDSERGWRARRPGNAIGTVFVFQRERVQREEPLVLITKQGTARPQVGAGARSRGNDGPRCLLVLCFEVLTDDPEFLNGTAWEGIASTVVLARHAPGRQIVLEAGAVYKHIGRIRAQPTASKRSRVGIDPVFGRDDTGRQRREVEEVAACGWELLHLLRGDVDGHFRRTQLDRGGARDRHGGELDGAGLEIEVDEQRRPDLYGDRAPLRRAADVPDGQVIGRRYQPSEDVRAVAATLRRALHPRGCVLRLDVCAGNGSAVLILHVSTDRAGSRLCARRYGDRQDGDANDENV